MKRLRWRRLAIIVTTCGVVGAGLIIVVPYAWAKMLTWDEKPDLWTPNYSEQYIQFTRWPEVCNGTLAFAESVSGGTITHIDHNYPAFAIYSNYDYGRESRWYAEIGELIPHDTNTPRWVILPPGESRESEGYLEASDYYVGDNQFRVSVPFPNTTAAEFHHLSIWGNSPRWNGIVLRSEPLYDTCR